MEITVDGRWIGAEVMEMLIEQLLTCFRHRFSPLISSTHPQPLRLAATS